MFRGLKQYLVFTRTQRPHRNWARPVFESPMEVPVSSGLPQGQGLWVQQTCDIALLGEVIINPTIEPLSRWPTNCRKNIPRKLLHCFKKVVGPINHFPTWGSDKGTENPQGICFWRPVGFDYRTCTGLGKQTLEEGGGSLELGHQRFQRNSRPGITIFSRASSYVFM